MCTTNGHAVLLSISFFLAAGRQMRREKLKQLWMQRWNPHFEAGIAALPVPRIVHIGALTQERKTLLSSLNCHILESLRYNREDVP